MGPTVNQLNELLHLWSVDRRDGLEDEVVLLNLGALVCRIVSTGLQRRTW